MSYITRSDITDKIADGIDMTSYILESDQSVEDLAERVGVRDTTEIETSPVHYKIRRYAIVYALMRMVQDRVGSVNADSPDSNIYLIQYSMYRKEMDSLIPQINAQMFTGDVSAISDRVSSVELWRS